MGERTNASDGIEVRRARLRGGREALPLRRTLEAVLADCSAQDIGLPPRALLILPRVAPRVPLPAGSPARQADFRQAMRGLLQDGRRQAARPWSSPEAAAGRPVLFADRAELAACLIRDWLGGSLRERWWASAVLGTAGVRDWWRRELLPRGDLLVPVLRLLSAAGVALAWVRCLEPPELSVAARAIATAYGLDADDPKARTDGPRPSQRDTPAPDLALARAGLAWRVPEVVAVVGSQARVRLLALGLGLDRDPAWCRSAEFALALEAIAGGIEAAAQPDVSGSAADAEQPVTTDADETGDKAGERAAATRGRPQPADHQAAAMSPTGFAAGRGMRAPPEMTGGDAVVGAEQRDAAAPGAAGLPWAEPGRGRDGAEPHGARPEPSSESPSGARLRPSPEDQGDGPPGLGDAGQFEMSTSGRRTLTISNHESSTPITEPDPTTCASCEAAPWPPEAMAVPPLTEIVETLCGGLLYLLNVALALNLYGDFTQPRRPGIALSPWDWLALVGRRWLGCELCADPLWELLRRLAVRSDGQPPGAGFTPPGTWLVPADWPAPWGAAGPVHIGPVHIEGYRARLRLWHPAGFLLADVPRRAGVSPMVQARGLLARWPVLTWHDGFRFARSSLRGDRPRWQPRPSPLARWLDQLLPYLEARLALALGVDDPASVPLLVCRHRARVEVSSTALDVHFSLAELPIALRVAGLDRDPGWLPAAGRSIAFHFQ